MTKSIEPRLEGKTWIFPDGRTLPLISGGDETAGDPPANDGEGEPPAPAVTSDWKAPASQDELDRIINDRLNRERSKFADYDDLKARAAKLAEIETASLSDLEKERQAREAAESKAQAAVETANARLIRAAINEAATAGNAVDSATVAKLLDTSTFTVNEDGTVEGAAEAVAALLTASPYLVKAPVATGGGDTNPGRDRNAGQISDIKGLSPAEIAKALKEGRLNTLLAGK